MYSPSHAHAFVIEKSKPPYEMRARESVCMEI
jgi:hypothetical protein